MKQVTVRDDGAFMKTLLYKTSSTLISRLIEKVGKSQPRTASGIAHKTYYGGIGRSISSQMHHWTRNQCVIMG